MRKRSENRNQTFRAGTQEFEPTRERKEKPEEGRELVFRANKDGYYDIPMDIMANVRIITPKGFEQLDVNIVYVFPPTKIPEVGISEDRPKVRSADDVKRLFQVQGIIAGTEKGIDRESERPKINQMIYNVGMPMAAINIGQNLRPETSRIYSAAENLAKAVKVITDNRATNTRNEIYRTFLLDQIERIKGVLTAQLQDALDVTRAKVELRQRLIAAGTCNYLWNKFINSKLTLPPDTALETILFPIKAENGLSLTTEELRAQAVRNVFRDRLINSDPIVRTVNSADYLTVIGAAQPADSEDEVLRIHRFPWLIIPSGPRAEFILNRRYTHKTNQGRSQLMQTINEFYMDLFLGISPLDVDVVAFWAQTVAGNINPAPGQLPLAQQAAALIIADPANNRYNKVREQPTLDLLNWFGVASERVRNLVANAPIIPLIAGVAAPINGLLQHIDKPENATVDSWLGTRPQLQELAQGKDKKKRRNPILFLDKEAKDFLTEIEADEDHVLHDNASLIRSFLGSFADDRYRSLAVRMFRSYEPIEDESDED